MARIIIEESNFEEARAELAAVGIILYKRPHRKGGYVCRAGRGMLRAARENSIIYESNDEIGAGSSSRREQMDHAKMAIGPIHPKADRELPSQSKISKTTRKNR